MASTHTQAEKEVHAKPALGYSRFLFILIAGFAIQSACIFLFLWSRMHPAHLAVDNEKISQAIGSTRVAVQDMDVALVNFIMTGDTGELSGWKQSCLTAQSSFLTLTELAGKMGAKDAVKNPAVILDSRIMFGRTAIGVRQTNGVSEALSYWKQALKYPQNNSLGKELETVDIGLHAALNKKEANSSYMENLYLIVIFGSALFSLCYVIQKTRLLKGLVQTLQSTSEGVIQERDELKKTSALRTCEAAENHWARTVAERRREQIELVLDSLDDGILLVGRHGTMLYINEAAANSLGWKPAELMDQPVTRVWSEENSPATPHQWENHPLFKSIMENKELREFTAVLKKKDGVRYVVPIYSHSVIVDSETVSTVVTFRP